VGGGDSGPGRFRFASATPTTTLAILAQRWRRAIGQPEPRSRNGSWRIASASGLSDARLPFLLGVIAEGKGDRSAADAWFAKSLAANPHSAASASAFSEVLLNRGDLDGALREADRAIALDPRVEGAHYCRGRCSSVGKRRGGLSKSTGARSRTTPCRADFSVPDESRPPPGRLPRSRRFSRPRSTGIRTRRFLASTVPAISSTGPRTSRTRWSSPSRVSSSLRPTARSAFACLLLADLFDRLGDAGRSRQFAERGKGARARG
jgi:tetratricopeptide (TPR) repeat protein